MKRTTKRRSISLSPEVYLLLDRVGETLDMTKTAFLERYIKDIAHHLDISVTQAEVDALTAARDQARAKAAAAKEAERLAALEAFR